MKTIPEDAEFLLARQRMVEEQIRRRGIADERVLRAMSLVPRQIFVDPGNTAAAYRDEAVAVGFGATVSQPFMVATMLQSLRVQPDSRVLEVGSGTGYQAALLGELAADVVSIERIEPLAVEERANLEWLKTTNVEVLVGDGSLGYAPRAPYDRIIVAAAAPTVPSALLQQLADGGVLLIPIGPATTQVLHRITRVGNESQIELLDICRFVPLIGEQGNAPTD